MSSYWVKRAKEQVEKTTVLGLNYNGFTVTPSNKEYYSEYMYKIEVYGNSIKYDIDLHNEIDKWLNDSWYFGVRSQWTNKNRLLFFKNIDQLNNFLKLFPQSVRALYGPVDREHVENLLLPDIKIKKIYKEKFWYNKYDIKLETTVRFSDNSQLETAELKKRSKDFYDFVNDTVSDCQWYSNHMAGWRNNYVYMTEKEFKVLQPWIKLAYDEIVSNVFQIYKI
tara:strand:- start:2728 stop:3396 length:669 start_codon:yes stop_codon:yes gene_type:complete